MHSVTEKQVVLGAVILAAGRSRRMGRPKMLLPWGTTTIIGHIVETWRELGAAQVGVVCAADDSAVAAELDKLQMPRGDRILNPSPDDGMFSSIQCAARWPNWMSSLTHFAIILGDQPHLRRETLETLMRFCAAHPERLCQPSVAGRPAHPVFLPQEHFFQLQSARVANLKEFLRACPVVHCEVTDAGLHLDLDRPEDYERALRMR